ncbi:MAG: hypothetical protein BGO26_20015 [Actinobacteria bacterium 69-20]|nr:MAG: hypothetical protein BGO26_20015 [Actinobacteria bacterium 69-20]
MLLRKDLGSQWVPALVLLAVELVTVVSIVAQFPPEMRQSAGTFVQGVASIGTFVMAYRAVASQESAGVIGFLKSLPLTTDEIFGSRFVFLAGYVIANCAALNVTYAALRPLLGFSTVNPSWAAMVTGVVIQLVFAVLLVSVALLANSEKAIWVPFPLVIVLLNLYTMMTSKPNSWGSSLLANVRSLWALYGLLAVVVLVALTLLVMGLLRTKRTLVR